MSIENDKPLQVLRPAIWPDDNVFYWILAVETVALLAGVILHNPGVFFSSLGFMAVLPGMPLFFHTIFHLSVKVRIFDDRFVITSFAGDNFIKLAQRQELFFKDVAYVYYLEKEIEFLKAFCSHFEGLKNLKTEEDFTFHNISKKYNVTQEKYNEALQKVKKIFPEIDLEGAGAFLQTKLNLKKYIWTQTRAKGYVATLRVKAYLVLSTMDGSKKAYFANFYDLSGNDSRRFLKILKEKNPNINFLMNTNQVRRLFPS